MQYFCVKHYHPSGYIELTLHVNVKDPLKLSGEEGWCLITLKPVRFVPISPQVSKFNAFLGAANIWAGNGRDFAAYGTLKRELV